MTKVCSALALMLLAGAGCASTPEPKSPPVKTSKPAANLEASIERALDLSRPALLYNEPTAPREVLDTEGLRFVGMDDGPVPDFSVETQDGIVLDSRNLVGEEPFIVVFFATWCQVCDLKMPVLKRVFEEVGAVRTIMVSVDTAETWPHVSGYLKEHQVAYPVVSALAYPRFAASYNPFQAVPLVVVVGQNGGLVDYQMGFADTHHERLTNAIRLARTIGPLKQTDADSALPIRGTHAGAGQADYSGAD